MNLLFPGRHLVNTRFQEEYLLSILQHPLSQLEFLGVGPDFPSDATLDTIVFAITSSNRDNSRFNPVSYDKRIVAVDRFAQQFKQIGVKHRIVGIPDFGTTERFAQLTLKEILEETEGEFDLTPENTVVVCSTPSVIQLYQKEGFAILPAELSPSTGTYTAKTPIDLVRRIAETGGTWMNDPVIRRELSLATRSAFLDSPEVPRKIIRIFNDPLLTEEGGITEKRNYDTYVIGMGNREIVELKYNDIKYVILEGKIIDHGCADGAMIQRMWQDHPDSDFYGMDASSEMIARAKERQRMGHFGKDTFVSFRHGNITRPMFTGPTANTITNLSLLHEIWSFGEQKKSIDDYLQSVFNQLVPGGRFVSRDVVAPEDKEQEVYLWCNPDDGSNENPYAVFDEQEELAKYLDGLSTRARFLRFAQDFLAGMRRSGRRGPETQISYGTESVGGQDYFVLPLKGAAEFMMTQSYTDNWEKEMDEEFTFFSFSEWKKVLSDAGFSVIENPNEPSKGSRVYANPYRVEKWKGHMELYKKANGSLKPMDNTVTNVVLVGEKR